MERSFWQIIKDSDYAVPDGHSLHELTVELVEQLGSPDPALRDECAYSILSYWIERGLYSNGQLRELTMQLISNLTFGLGDKATDTVFIRSFSALVLADILNRETAKPFLTEHEYQNIFRWAIEYLLTERDLRGYVKRKGWAHSVAHTADLLRRLARHRYARRDDLERMLLAIADKVTRKGDYIYVHNEDQRLAQVVWTVLQRDLLDMTFLTAWLAQCVNVMALAGGDGFNAEAFGAYQNTRQLLRSVYFRMAFSKKHPKLVTELKPKVLAAVKAVGG